MINSYHRITQAEAKEMMKKDDGHVVVDVRRPDEFAEGHIPGAISVPLSVIEQVTLPKDKPLFVYCLRGTRSRRAVNRLKRMGYQNVQSIGGITSFKGQVEKE